MVARSDHRVTPSPFGFLLVTESDWGGGAASPGGGLMGMVMAAPGVELGLRAVRGDGEKHWV
jgi:hypothetical protein